MANNEANFFITTFLTSVKRCVLPLLVFLLPLPSVAQLANFTLTVTKTDETCLGNGTLTFTSTGLTAGSTVTYYVYQLPDQTNPIAIQSANFIAGRTSGTYKIVAVQILGNEQNSQTATVTIDNAIVALSYTITSTNSICNDGVLTVTVINGVGAHYEIIAGPVIRPIQNSPIFTMLPAGVYQVRAFDNCGDATVITHTLLSGATTLNIGTVNFPEPELPTCTSIIISNVLTSGANQTINYPLTCAYMMHFPDGTNQTILETITTGNATEYEAMLTIPFYYDQSYTYDLTVTDSCSNTYVLNNNIVNQKLAALLVGTPAKCGAYFLTAGAAIYRPPIQIQFLEAPSGFDPDVLNPAHPGPFTSQTTEYGTFLNPVPFGHYVIQVSDGCGHVAIGETTLTYIPAAPTHIAVPLSGCSSNYSKVTVTIPGYTMVSAIITAAPPAYGPVPSDVSNFIATDDGLILENLITGTYTVAIIDDCGNNYSYNFTVQDLFTTISYASRSGCEIGKGSARIRGNNTLLTSVIITAAPASFAQTLPYNATSLIGSDGSFSMGNLNPGSYSYTVVDNCGITHNAILNVVGYEITSNTYSITPYCGSFDLLFSHTSTAVGESFWLQKFDTVTNSWVHPTTGSSYIDGTLPSSLDSYPLVNNSSSLNLTFLGNFRIVKSFQSFDNGNIGTFTNCIEIIQTFTFDGKIQFTDIEKINCSGNLIDVKLSAIGAPPLHYSIVAKNNVPFFIDNGSSNIFYNLEPALYTFRVDQSCGDFRNYVYNIGLLPSPAIANQVADLFACDDSSKDGKEIFTLTDQNAGILGTQNPSLYTISYHLSLAAANANSDPLPDAYFSGNSEIYCRLQFNNSANCYDVISFHLVVNPFTDNAPRDVYLCENQSIVLTGDNGFTSYHWSTGETSQSITISQGGQYTLDVTTTYPNGVCSQQFVYTVTASSAPVIDHLNSIDWTDTENSIEVVLQNNSANILYSLDNVVFQSSPIFSNLLPGGYTVYAKDPSCGSDSTTTFLLNYPKFFTPNGDGVNDYWNIKFSSVEPHMKTFIYDRFGKLITSFKPGDAGWDGTLNGQMLPSTDYWFVVIREDKRNLKGHFAMKR